MSTAPDPENDIVANYYDDYKQTQAYIVLTESKQVRKSIFIIAALLFASDMLGMAMANLITAETILYSAVIPLILVGIGFLAIKQPLLAIILAALVFAGLIILSIILFGGVGAISGLLIKAVIIYFLISGFQSAREAERAKKELKN
jgi:hypothetical protein